MTIDNKFFLCSNSPRRFSLLRSLGLPFEKLLPPGGAVDEVSSFKAPFALVRDIAKTKAMSCVGLRDEGFLMGFDTIVVHAGKILGKPASEQDAFRMLRKLSGGWHCVYTGICVIRLSDKKIICDYERTRVKFRRLRDKDIEKYLSLVNPMDKAGAYNIEEYGGMIVERIDGCYPNVVGLPQARLLAVMEEFGVDLMELFA